MTHQMIQRKELHIDTGTLLPWIPEVFSRVRRGASFRRPQAEDKSGEAARKNTFRAGHLLRLDPNRKLRMKRLWHQGSTLLQPISKSQKSNP